MDINEEQARATGGISLALVWITEALLHQLDRQAFLRQLDQIAAARMDRFPETEQAILRAVLEQLHGSSAAPRT